MKTLKYKTVEFAIIFIILPISFALNYAPQIKLGIGLTGFVYIIYVLLKVEQKKFKLAKNLNFKVFFKHTLLKLIVIVAITTCFVWFTNPALLFNVMLTKPLLWLFILFFYSFFSVYPQELIYRTFYFERYLPIFKSKNVFLVINALVFSLAHLLFKNILVLVLTCIGGLLFALTYYKTKSTVLVSIEHAIYGCWLFTVGMGDMLGFPA
ncbi:hypothetical protein GCM10022291_25610 [Postechiella marina]|uniref:CAAX prenyl protease 2/Lysostaphin resistance protein A-like domain-containing protein n=1 Tax=Postechiella marina TaxID=943941 RepID=A0ABP8CDL6_9FLAO